MKRDAHIVYACRQTDGVGARLKRRSALARQLTVAVGLVLFAAAVGALSPLDLRASAPQDPQLLQGSVTDAASLEGIPGATVTLVTTGSVAQTGPDGSFGFSNAVPGRASLRIEAPGYQTTFWEGAIATDRLAPIAVFLSRPQDPGTIRVFVRADESGQPIAGAVVSIPDLNTTVATDQAGAVVLPDVRPGLFLVTVSSLGYASLTSLVGLQESSVALEVVLPSEPIPLDPVVVEAEANFQQRLENAGFYERRATGLGAFLDRADIERAAPVMPSELFRLMPGVDLLSVGRGTPEYALVGRRGFSGFRSQDSAPDGPDDPYGGCRMQLFIDGTLHRTDLMESYDYATGESVPRVIGITLDALVPVEWIEAIEVYPSSSRLPQQFSVAGGQCGVVLVWTRAYTIATASSASTATARETRDVQLGDEVRLNTAVMAGQFRVVEMLPGSLMVQADPGSEPLEVPSELIDQLEVRLGKSLSYSKGAFFGTLTGALAGTVVLVTCNFPHFRHYGCLGGASPKAGALMTVGLGSIVGLVIAWTSDDVWAGGRLPLGP
jgi:hypothetical protein